MIVKLSFLRRDGVKFAVQRDRENYIYYVNRNFMSILANLEGLIFKIFFVGPNHGGASYRSHFIT